MPELRTVDASYSWRLLHSQLLTDVTDSFSKGDGIAAILGNHPKLGVTYAQDCDIPLDRGHDVVFAGRRINHSAVAPTAPYRVNSECVCVGSATLVNAPDRFAH
jgi:hypothetical protein